MPDLPGLDQLLHGACDICHWHIRIDTVLVEEVDHVRAQTLQGLISDLPDTFWPAVLGLRGVTVFEAKFCRNHDLAADRLQCFAYDFLVDKGAVGFCRVEESNPSCVGLADQTDGFRSVG